MQVLEPAEALHPRLVRHRLGGELLRDGLRDELAQRYTVGRRFCFSLSEQSIGDLECRLHDTSVPYLWERTPHHAAIDDCRDGTALERPAVERRIAALRR